jgi:hypothetical protein
MMSNPWSDFVTKMRHVVISRMCLTTCNNQIFRYSHTVACDDMGFFNISVCKDISRATPVCLDAAQFAIEHPLAPNKVRAMDICWAGVTPWEKDESGWNPYDRRHKVSGNMSSE